MVAERMIPIDHFMLLLIHNHNHIFVSRVPILYEPLDITLILFLLKLITIISFVKSY